ncbi:MAG TPA: alpha/beta hydrolase domain-containing protein [Pseudolabrys sp.]|jgi:hypothetical protein|nr:alpha/beta hydrolase domain-containing protein [Pseudolabrys sp.]
MCHKTNRPLRYLVPAIAIFGAVIGWSSPSDADVQKIVIDQTATVNFTPIILGSSTPGPLTSYTIYVGRIFGELDPNDPQNSIITDIDHAPRTHGKVEYIANFEIVTPTYPEQRSGLMIHQVPNRGNNAINTASLIQGATYVQSGWQGDLLAQCSPSAAISYPCFDLNSGPYGTLDTTTGVFTPPKVSDVIGLKTLASYVVQIPLATTDGKVPNGDNTITGQVYSHVCTGTNGCGLAVGSAPTSTAQLVIQGPAFAPYHPASMDTKQAQFWTVSSQTFTGVDSKKTPIASDQWAWAYCPSGWPGTPNPNWICLKGATFNPSLEYEMAYTAANPLVLGVGFAAFRDLASFLRYRSTAPGGGSNPIAGTVSKAFTIGGSQSAAFLHGFIFWGFNEDGRDGRDNWGHNDSRGNDGDGRGHDKKGRIVFDGAWPQIDGRMMVMNIRWGQPNNLMYLYMGGDEAPVWWADYPNLARHLPPNGMFHRCARNDTCPAILETFASAELYSEKMSASLCGFTCVSDIPLPSNVYRYYSPNATHGGGTVNFNWTSPTAMTIPPGQSLPNNPIPLAFTNNALQYAFIQLLMKGTRMPRSVYPTLHRGELVPNTQHAVGFPNVPGLPFGGNQAWPPFVYNFGPKENYDQESGVPTIQPPIIEKVLPVFVAKVNADGNEDVDGMPTVLGEAPLGTYVGWNLATTGWYGPNASNGPGSVGQVFAGAGNSGGYWPFWDTKANRQSAGDPRLSLEERYGTHAGYVCVVTAAANKAVQQGFLLVSDAQNLISQATASNVLVGYFATAADTALASSLCSKPNAKALTATGRLQ